MNAYDFSPLFRYSIGFDRLETLLTSAVDRADRGTSYPPYNIESATENSYRISMAVAGFNEKNLEVIQEENSLIVNGKAKHESGEDNYLHRGIANRAFERRFDLADHVKVIGANIDSGMLTIDLEREVPDALKARRIQIKSGAGASLVGKAKKLLGQEENEAA